MEVRAGYKQSDVGVIPEDWELKCLIDLCVSKGLVRGPFGGSLKKDCFVKAGYKIYEQRNAIYKNAQLGEYFIDLAKYCELKRFQISPSDFIVSCSGTIGRIYLIPQHSPAGIINQALLKITTDDEAVSKQYFMHYFEWDKFQEKIIDNTQGGAMKNLVGMSVFRETKIPIPPTLSEQTAIATVLSDTDALIQSLDRLIAKKRLIKQGTMQELLTGKRRLPGFSGEWEQKNVGDMAEVGRGRVISHKEISTAIEAKYPVYSSQTSYNGIMGYIDTYDFDGEYVTWTTDGVNAGKVFYRSGRFNCTNVCGAIKLKVDNPQFIARLLDTVTSRYVSKNLANPKLMNAPMKQITVYVPPLAEQTAIADILSDMDAEIEALEEKRDKYKMIKQGIMQELLTGRIRLI